MRILGEVAVIMVSCSHTILVEIWKRSGIVSWRFDDIYIGGI